MQKPIKVKVSRLIEGLDTTKENFTLKEISIFFQGSGQEESLFDDYLDHILLNEMAEKKRTTFEEWFKFCYQQKEAIPPDE